MKTDHQARRSRNMPASNKPAAGGDANNVPGRRSTASAVAVVCVVMVCGGCQETTRERAELGRWLLPSLVSQESKLVEPNNGGGNEFGGSVSVQADTAVIGAKGYQDVGKSVGATYVFVRTTAGGWVQQQRLLASDSTLGKAFGYSVSVDGDTAIIGAPNDSESGSMGGAAYVFTRSAATWTEQQKLLVNGSAYHEVGRSVAVDGDTVVVGEITGAAAYVFVRSGNTWSMQQALVPSDGPQDLFGERVALSGDTIVVGARKDDDNGVDSGAAYVFVRNGSTWTEEAKLLASDGVAGDGLGRDVAVSGDTAVVGAVWAENNSETVGAAYVFVRTGNTWNQQGKLLASDGADGDGFGISVSVDKDAVVVGAGGDDDKGLASGSAYVFTRSSGGSWQQEHKLLASDGAYEDQFGTAVAIDDATLLIGAYHSDAKGGNSGAAYVFSAVWDGLDAGVADLGPDDAGQDAAAKTDGAAIDDVAVLPDSATVDREDPGDAADDEEEPIHNDGQPKDGDGATPQKNGDGASTPDEGCSCLLAANPGVETPLLFAMLVILWRRRRRRRGPRRRTG